MRHVGTRTVIIRTFTNISENSGNTQDQKMTNMEMHKHIHASKGTTNGMLTFNYH